LDDGSVVLCVLLHCVWIRTNLEIDVLARVGYEVGVRQFSPCWARLALVTVLGAGSAALAGDKLHFSAAGDTLDLPAAAKADSGTDQISLFHAVDPMRNMVPFIPLAPSSDEPARQKGATHPGTDFWQNGIEKDSFWSPAGVTNFGDFNNTSNQWNGMRAWSPSEQDASLRRQMEGMDAHGRPTDRTLDSVTARDARNRQDDPSRYGSLGARDWAFRSDSGSAADRGTARDIFRAPSGVAASTKAVNPAGGFGGFGGNDDKKGFGSLDERSPLSSYLTPRTSAFASPSVMPASQYNLPFSGTGTGYGPHTTAALREPGPGDKSPIGQPVLSLRLRGLESLGDSLNGFQGAGGAGASSQHKPLNPSEQQPGQQPRNGLDLAWPKRPGAIMN